MRNALLIPLAHGCLEGSVRSTETWRQSKKKHFTNASLTFENYCVQSRGWEVPSIS